MKRPTITRFARHYAEYFLIVAGVALVIVVVLGLLGPATGNVFSNIYSYAPPPSYRPSGDGPTQSALPAPTPDGLVAIRQPAAPYRVNRLIIKNGELALIVADTDRAVNQISQLAVSAGGYIISSRTWQQDSATYAALILGVPVDQFEAVQRQLRALALRVTSDTASGQDVSEEYVDLQARLINLEATAARLRELLQTADDVEAALNVNSKLAEVEGEMEQIKGRMAYLQDRSAYSTLTVNVEPQRPTPTATPSPTPTPTATPDVWQPDQTLAAAGGRLDAMLRGLGDLAIWLGVTILPFAVPAAIIGGVGWRVRRKRG